mmetsp:Transcript_100896/g.290082  ORF Transcript_100896/g.290082 Transcript_100896/m.290082 type:complete len:210 (+) Transcript_100896:264-893(+)
MLPPAGRDPGPNNLAAMSTNGRCKSNGYKVCCPSCAATHVDRGQKSSTNAKHLSNSTASRMSSAAGTGNSAMTCLGASPEQHCAKNRMPITTTPPNELRQLHRSVRSIALCMGKCMPNMNIGNMGNAQAVAYKRSYRNEVPQAARTNEASNCAAAGSGWSKAARSFHWIKPKTNHTGPKETPSAASAKDTPRNIVCGNSRMDGSAPSLM